MLLTYLRFNIIIFRTGEIEEEAIAHEGNKAARAIFLKNGLVFTTGFTKHSERQYSLRAPGHLDDPIVMVELDTSNGVMFPLYDPDANLIYLCGKVGSSILALIPSEIGRNDEFLLKSLIVEGYIILIKKTSSYLVIYKIY